MGHCGTFPRKCPTFDPIEMSHVCNADTPNKIPHTLGLRQYDRPRVVILIDWSPQPREPLRVSTITSEQPVRVAEQQLSLFGDRVRAIRDSLHKVVVGQEPVIDQLLVC